MTSIPLLRALDSVLKSRRGQHANRNVPRSYDFQLSPSRHGCIGHWIVICANPGHYVERNPVSIFTGVMNFPWRQKYR